MQEYLEELLELSTQDWDDEFGEDYAEV